MTIIESINVNQTINITLNATERKLFDSLQVGCDADLGLGGRFEQRFLASFVFIRGSDGN